MPVATVNEPYEKLQQLLAAQSALVAVIGTRYGLSNMQAMGGFPCLTIDLLSNGAGPNDAEHTQYMRDRLQLNLYGDDQAQLRYLANLVDALNEQIEGQPSLLDSTHWKCKVLRRDGPWRMLTWDRSAGGQSQSHERPTASGNPLYQLTSDWRFENARRQDVA